MSANVHGLLHLPDVVKNLGPLWSHSCFPFESANGHILKLFHGSQGVEKQVQVHDCSVIYTQVCYKQSSFSSLYTRQFCYWLVCNLPLH